MSAAAMSSSERHRASTQPDTMHSLSAASPCTSNAATLRQPRGAQRPCLAQARPGCGVQSSDEIDASRRGALLGLAASLASATLLGGAAPQVASAATPVVEVGSYLPPAEGLPGFCLYSPDAKKTPAIRAGVITAEPAYYKFAVPGNWAEAPLLNPLTGNFCMPRCEEPWYEFKFENPKEGTAQLIVTENQKLGAKPSASLKELGSPEQVVGRIGNFITGTSDLDEEDIVSAEAKQLGDGRTYYVYEVYTPYSKTTTHNLAAFTTKNGLAYLFTLSATDKQWSAAQDKLRTMLASFQA